MGTNDGTSGTEDIKTSEEDLNKVVYDPLIPETVNTSLKNRVGL